MKKINTTLLLGALLGFCACHFESFDERCAREAREYTEKQCPRRMDQYTLMDSLTYDDHSRTLNYYYTLEGVLDNNTVMNAQACESLKDLLRKNVVNSVDLKSYKEKRYQLFLLLLFQGIGKSALSGTVHPGRL